MSRTANAEAEAGADTPQASPTATQMESDLQCIENCIQIKGRDMQEKLDCIRARIPKGPTSSPLHSDVEDLRIMVRSLVNFDAEAHLREMNENQLGGGM